MLVALDGARGKPGRLARAAAAEAFRSALLAALPPGLPDRGDAIVDAVQTVKWRDADALRATTIVAIREALRRAVVQPPTEGDTATA